MKIVTFNIRGDFGTDGPNNFCFRQPLIHKKLRADQPDIIGFQEVMPHMAAWLRDILPEYCVLGCGRDADLTGEAMLAAFRRDRYNLVEMRTFWLSPTPEVPGSRYPEQSHCPRTATELLLLEYATGKVYRVVNTHLDHEGAQARLLGLTQILRHLEQVALFPDAPVILMGDFNAEPDSDELRPITDHPAYTNAAKNAGGTFHAFSMAEKPVCIDYIFLKGALHCVRAGTWQDHENGVFLSDHYPVYADVLPD